MYPARSVLPASQGCNDKTFVSFRKAVIFLSKAACREHDIGALAPRAIDSLASPTHPERAVSLPNPAS